MMIEFDVSDAPDGFSNRRAHREIRYKMAIHDIDMNHGDNGLFHTPNLFAQAREVRREYRRKDLKHATTRYMASRRLGKRPARCNVYLRPPGYTKPLACRTLMKPLDRITLTLARSPGN